MAARTSLLLLVALALLGNTSALGIRTVPAPINKNSVRPCTSGFRRQQSVGRLTPAFALRGGGVELYIDDRKALRTTYLVAAYLCVASVLNTAFKVPAPLPNLAGRGIYSPEANLFSLPSTEPCVMLLRTGLLSLFVNDFSNNRHNAIRYTNAINAVALGLTVARHNPTLGTSGTVICGILSVLNAIPFIQSL